MLICSCCNLHCLSSPSVGLTEDVITARRERKAQSATTLGQVLTPKHESLPEISQFLTESHSSCTASKLVDRARGAADGVALDMVKQSHPHMHGQTKLPMHAWGRQHLSDIQELFWMTHRLTAISKEAQGHKK
jgi:hypothetical protein